jgi:uncharacterized membrane protein YfcA
MTEIFYLPFIAFFVGLINSISGGAGVFAVPLMLVLGISPVNTLLLNRSADLGGLIGAFLTYNKAKKINWKLAFISVFPLTAGTFIGANFAISISEILLKKILIFAVFIAIILILNPIKPKRIREKISSYRKYFLFVLLFVLGIWDGMVGMAGITFCVLIFAYITGKDFLIGISTTLTIFIPSTLTAVIVLYGGANINWYLPPLMFLFSFIGSCIGAKIAVKRGDGLIKKAMVAISFVMLIKLIVDIVNNH